MLRWIYQIFKIILLLALPFILLIRGAVFCYLHYEWPSWLALLGGALGAIVVLFIYLSFVHGKLTGRMSGGGAMKRRTMIVFILVMGYCAHGLFFLSGSNAKGDAVRSEFTSLHPILRLGVSTLIFMDADLMITDASRHPEDYKKMGLKALNRSLHYPQSNGYVHALDIRTIGRNEVRNQLLTIYFRMMGFNTLRHTGTADHLHISLTSPDSPGAI